MNSLLSRRLRVLEDPRGRADVIGVREDRLLALRVRQDERLGVPLLEPDELPLAERLVDDAAPLPRVSFLRPTRCSTQRPRFLSGAKRISLSAGSERTIFSALDDVTM